MIMDITDLTVELLDELVHEVADSLATEANSGGVKDQLLLLNVVGGWTNEEVLDYIKK